MELKKEELKKVEYHQPQDDDEHAETQTGEISMGMPP